MQLEDGTTAYITPACASSLFTDSEQFDPTTLNLEPLGSQFDDGGADTKPVITMSSNPGEVTAINVVSVSMAEVEFYGSATGALIHTETG